MSARARLAAALLLVAGCGTGGSGGDGDAGPRTGSDGSPPADGGADGLCPPEQELPDRSWSEPLPPHDAWVPCGGGYECEWMDVRVYHEIHGREHAGLKLRIVRPAAAGDEAPLYVTFPGTGTCMTRPDAPEQFQMELASRGVLTAGLSLRGHVDCYPEGDPMYRASTWIGPDEMGDYDRLIWAFVQGWVRDDLPRADPRRIGFGGVSHGAITTLVYARHACLPSVTGHPFALITPSAGAAAVSEWVDPGLDPDESPPSSFGSARLTGLPAQARAYSGRFWGLTREQVRDGAPTPLLEDQVDYRTVYDEDGGLSSMLGNVAHGLLVMGTHDCIVPRGGMFELYRRLREAGAADRFRLYTQVAHHSCKEPDPDGMSLPPSPEDNGYYPRWTLEAMDAIREVKDSIHLRWVEAFLLDRGGIDEMPEWLYMLADETDEEGELPTVYAAEPPGELGTGTWRRYLDGTSLEAGPPDSGDEWTLAHDPGDCTEVDVVEPCSPPPSGVGALRFVSEPLSEPLLVVGAPRVTVEARESAGRPYTLTAVLAEVPDPSDPSRIWPVSSGRRHDATPQSGPEELTVELDDMVHRFEVGHAVMLILTTGALPVNDAPMFAPSVTPFELTLSGGSGAALELPVVDAAPVPAPDEWQHPDVAGAP